MKYGIVKDIILYAVILLVQILILNHIHLFGVATPLLYVYLIMLLKRNCPRWALLLIAFVMGVIVDIFSDRQHDSDWLCPPLHPHAAVEP